MAVLKARLEWFGAKGQNEAIVIDAWTKIQIKISTELKNNQMTITLKNNFGRVSGRQFTKSNRVIALDSSGFFQVDDKFKFYCKYDTNNSGLDLGENSNDLIFFGDLRQLKSRTDDSTMIDIICTDRTFNLLNGLWWQAYTSDGKDSPNGQGWTSPLIIQDVVRQKAWTNKDGQSSNELIYDEAGNLRPSKHPATAFYGIDARLKSQGGLIQDNRSKTIDKFGNETSRSIGTPDSSTALFPTTPVSTRNHNFPFKNYTTVGKPIYETLLELSQVDKTNTNDELDPENTSFDPIIKRAMRFYIDEKNRFHWFYPTDTIDTDKSGLNSLTISMGTVNNFYEVKSDDMDFVIFDVLNYIYYEAGIDMEGDTILGFEYDKTSSAPSFKESKRVWPRIAEQMKREDEKAKNIVRNASQKGGYNYPTSYGTGLRPAWNRNVTVDSDSEYNSEFKKEARKRASDRAKRIISGIGSQRWKGTINFRFFNFTVGDLMQYTNNAGGIYQEKLRITEINHIIDSNAGASTTLTVEADEKEIDQ